MTTLADLTTIRKLSQYRPFERGGRDALEAQEDLVLAALAEAGGSIDGIAACAAAISALFTLDYDDIEIARAVNSLLARGDVERSGTHFVLSDAERERLEEAASESVRVASQAITEWLRSVAARFPGLSQEEQGFLRADLDAYLRVVIQRHGAEAALLLYPDDAEAQRLYEDLEDLGFDFLEQRSPRVHHIRQFALSQFMRNPTEAQRAFLSQNLSTGYFWTVLSIDPEGARLVQELAAGQRVYLDTNFIFRLLGIQGPHYIRPAEILLERTHSAGYETCVSPWTVEELKRRLRASRDFLKRFPVPPSDYAGLAADASSEDDFVTLYWRRVRDEPGLKVDDFLAYYSEVETHLAAIGIPTRGEGCEAVVRRHQDIHEEVVILERVMHGGRQRALKTLQHDVMHRLLIEKRRGDANRTFATAGAWFLTYDSVLPRYDNLARRGTSELPFCVSAASWFQVVEAFSPKSGDLTQALADLLASPYVRYRRTLSKESAHAIVARTHLHADGTPELAARVLMNTAALEQIEGASGTDEQVAKIDSALIEAAREVQEEAQRAKEQAEEAREHAVRAEAEADRRAQEAERLKTEAIASERALRDDAIRSEAARGTEALRNETARASEHARAQEARHRAELDAANQRAARHEAIARRTRRRLRLGIGLVLGVALFLVLGLATGLDTAWVYLLGFAVLLGTFAAFDQLANRSDPVPTSDDEQP